MLVYMLMDIEEEQFVGAGLRLRGVPKIWKTVGQAKTSITYQANRGYVKKENYKIVAFKLIEAGEIFV